LFLEFDKQEVLDNGIPEESLEKKAESTKIFEKKIKRYR